MDSAVNIPTPHPKKEDCIALIPRLEGLGGPTSFNQKLIAGLNERGIRTTYDLDDPAVRVVLVNGGTRHLERLARARRRGLRVVQRLDGMNWVQRKRRLGLRHFLRAEINNWILATIRRRLADAIVYQSAFSQDWWTRVYGDVHKPGCVVHNGVDLSAYTPDGPECPPADRIRLVAVEGHWGGGNDLALDNTLILAQALAGRLSQPLELCVVGDVPAALRMRWQNVTQVGVNWVGVLSREQIAGVDRSAHLFFSAELMAPCPNSVIEAMACGAPVLAYDTGSLGELVRDGAGRVVPYGDDPWSLEPARPEALVEAALKLLADQPAARRAARERAEMAFALPRMVDGYCAVLFEGGVSDGGL
jgi:glycosyltransferase involved in cell wall biosynthesis